ncbi:MAG TPA: hypothetical protein VJ792_05130 [Candidatus Nitrosotalea sp.]|nr:hypothetical protein [Candidatus Nitrosotalea sp.]
MNIYDKRQVNCATCGKQIGEVDDDAKILFCRCGNCSGTENGENEIFNFLAEKFENTVKNVMTLTL